MALLVNWYMDNAAGDCKLVVAHLGYTRESTEGSVIVSVDGCFWRCWRHSLKEQATRVNTNMSHTGTTCPKEGQGIQDLSNIELIALL